MEFQCQPEYYGKGAHPVYVFDGMLNGYEEFSQLMKPDEKQGIKDLLSDPKFVGLWTWSRAVRGERIFVLWAGISYAMMIISHNGSAVQISPILFIYALWRGRKQIWLAISQIAIVVLIGIGLTSFYWVPALVELQYAQVASGYASTGIVYHQNFTPFSGLFTYPSLPVDSDLLNPIVSSPLAIVTIIFSGLTIWRTRLLSSK